MRRILRVIALLAATVLVMGSTCFTRHYITEVWLANWTQNPFHPNGGARLELGGSRDVLDLGHGHHDDITIVRNSVTWATLTVVSKVNENTEVDYEAVIRLEEEISGVFKATVVEGADYITVSVSYPSR